MTTAGTADEGQTVRPSLVDGAERALRNWLAPGRYRQGDRLPPEHEVAAMLGVSRGTLRSALQRLEESGEIGQLVPEARRACTARYASCASCAWEYNSTSHAPA